MVPEGEGGRGPKKKKMSWSRPGGNQERPKPGKMGKNVNGDHPTGEFGCGGHRPMGRIEEKTRGQGLGIGVTPNRGGKD